MVRSIDTMMLSLALAGTALARAVDDSKPTLTVSNTSGGNINITSSATTWNPTLPHTLLNNTEVSTSTTKTSANCKGTDNMSLQSSSYTAHFSMDYSMSTESGECEGRILAPTNLVSDFVVWSEDEIAVCTGDDYTKKSTCGSIDVADMQGAWVYSPGQQQDQYFPYLSFGLWDLPNATLSLTWSNDTIAEMYVPSLKDATITNANSDYMYTWNSTTLTCPEKKTQELTAKLTTADNTVWSFKATLLYVESEGQTCNSVLTNIVADEGDYVVSFSKLDYFGPVLGYPLSFDICPHASFVEYNGICNDYLYIGMQGGAIANHSVTAASI
eukprot:Clim_evm3s226 gene=Clim_evmTU3s226